MRAIAKKVETLTNANLRDDYRVFIHRTEDQALTVEDRETARDIVAAIEREAGRRWLKRETEEGE